MILNFAMPGMGEWLIIILIPIILFFAVRSILLWYWKVDVIVKNLEEIKSLLKDQNKVVETRRPETRDEGDRNEIERKARLYDEEQRKKE